MNGTRILSIVLLLSVVSCKDYQRYRTYVVYFDKNGAELNSHEKTILKLDNVQLTEEVGGDYFDKMYIQFDTVELDKIIKSLYYIKNERLVKIFSYLHSSDYRKVLAKEGQSKFIIRNDTLLYADKDVRIELFRPMHTDNYIVLARLNGHSSE